MKEKLKAALAKLHACHAEQKDLLAAEEPTAEQKARISALDTELDGLEAEAKELKVAADREEKAAQRSQWLTQPQNALPVGDPNPAPAEGAAVTTPATKALAIPRAGGRAIVFKDDPHSGGRAGVEKAYRFGAWALAVLSQGKMSKAVAFCDEHGIDYKAQSEGVLTAGGVLVPPEFDQDIIDLREVFGVARRITRVYGMGSDTRIIARRTGGLTAYPIGENEEITESSKSWDNVELVARKWGVLAKISSELNEDAFLDVGNDLAREIAYAFSSTEDDCLFNGDGTSTYHGITGMRSKFLALSATRAYIAGLIVGTDNVWSGLTLTDFEAVVGRLPQFADTPSTQWVRHRAFYWNVMIRLMLASGGVTEAEVSRQGRNVPFLGYPVTVAQKMPSVEANDTIPVLFGDFTQAVAFGDRRQTTIALSDQRFFELDQVAIRGTERFDLNVHDIGNANATAGSRVVGPVVALATAAS